MTACNHQSTVECCSACCRWCFEESQSESPIKIRPVLPVEAKHGATQTTITLTRAQYGAMGRDGKWAVQNYVP